MTVAAHNIPSPLEPVSHSMLVMWRCIICMAHADGVVTPPEREYLTRIFTNMERRRGLTAEQKAILFDDLANAKDVGSLLPQINDPVYRSQLIDFARILAYKDGNLHPDESVLLSKLHASVMGQVDMDAVRRHVHIAVKAQIQEHDLKVSQNRPQFDEAWGISAFFDNMLLRLGIDLMDE